MGDSYDRAVQCEDRFIVIKDYDQFVEKIAKENDY